MAVATVSWEVPDVAVDVRLTLVGTSVIVDQAPGAIRSALNVVGLVTHDELPKGG